jgi:hypothetical protein
MRCCTSAHRDKTTVAVRTEHEGLSFLAITLADFGKANQTWLDQGFVVPSDAPSFKTGRGRLTGLPTFLSGFLARVFDPCSGALFSDPDIEAIYAIQQLTLLFSKIALPTGNPVRGDQKRKADGPRVVTPARERRAMSEFIECEQDVRAADNRLDPSYMDDFRRVSAMLYGDLFAKVERDLYWGRVIMRHGPGSVADRLSSNAKFNQRTWPARLRDQFDPAMHLLVNRRYLGDLEGLNILEPGAEIPVRVITVPKTIKSPRVIAIEPTAMQYAQQGLYRAIREAIEEDSFLYRLIGIRDQEPNRLMAMKGSLRGDLATLDLSEASDRVSNQHVLALLEEWPLLSAAVQSCRSRKADVPGHRIMRLAKFASMGSALCFPIEAMVFATVIFVGIERELNAPLSLRTLIKRFGEQVRVFGDDLIVPRDYVLSVVSELENFGFRVNTSKSFWSGRFRESCGRQYYDGQDVSIVKVRQVLPTRRQDASGVISASEFRNLAYMAGLWKTAAWMDDYLRKLLLGVYPNVAPSSPLLGRVSFLGYEFQRLDPNTFGPLTKGYYKRAKAPEDRLSGQGALLKCLQQKEGSILPFAIGVDRGVDRLSHLGLRDVDDEHLERSGRPEYVSIKLGWRSPF